MTKEQATDILRQIVKAILDTIKEAGEMGAPSGPVYAALMGHMTIDTYNQIIEGLIAAKKIRRSNHVLYWVSD